MKHQHHRAGSADKRWVGRKLTEWRKRILEREPLCRACAALGLVVVAQEVDHLIPLEHGGDYSDENANPLCRPCHQEKTARDRGYRQKAEIGVDGWPLAM